MEHAKLPLSWGTSLRFFIAKSFGSKKLHPFLVSLLININVLDEVTFGWPRQRGELQLKEHLALNLQKAFNWVGLNGISLDKDPHSLSGSYKRRLALAIQLAQVPDLIILDEPLSGLVWKARADVVNLLKYLKKELTILIVSHDLKELEDLVYRSWRMEMGGVLREECLLV